jgi:outer membrane protein OmpA-like peptidoglycan-associated protein
MRCPGKRLLVIAGWALAVLPTTGSYAASPPGATSLRVPFVVGLTTVRAVSTPEGDYESLGVIDSIDKAGYRTVVSGEVPSDDGVNTVEISVARRVKAEDQRSARKMRIYFHTGDADSYPGTVPGFSAAVVNDLRTSGKAAFTYLEVNQIFGFPTSRQLTGTLTRIDGAPLMSMLVNGRPAQLSVIHAQGRLSDGSDADEYEYDVLDDPGNPILLGWSGGGSSTRIIRIEYPEPADAPNSMERKLSAHEPVQVYGIYFAFARADIRPQSERVLKEIAGILQAHPDWKLRVDGHTDNVGGDASNLDLSKRRAAAVKAALVTRYHVDPARLSTGGYGASSPQDRNDTAEGRARNRRVELRRQ